MIRDEDVKKALQGVKTALEGSRVVGTAGRKRGASLTYNGVNGTLEVIR